MAHLYHCEEWQAGSGRWYCNDIKDLNGVSAKWWAPARMLSISLTDYIIMLKEDFHATIVSYNKDTDVLIFYWDRYADAHRYVLYINSKARKINFMV